MKPLLVTSGEPAGVGLDICLSLIDQPHPVVIVADKVELARRAKQLGQSIQLRDYDARTPIKPNDGSLTVWSLPVASPVVPGHLEVSNSAYVLNMLSLAVKSCLSGEF
ncbi:MAG: hypothetical protein B7X00_00425, partial [Legionella sp. 21-45-4]